MWSTGPPPTLDHAIASVGPVHSDGIVNVQDTVTLSCHSLVSTGFARSIESIDPPPTLDHAFVSARLLHSVESVDLRDMVTLSHCSIPSFAFSLLN